jgi:hypothetical protein
MEADMVVELSCMDVSIRMQSSLEVWCRPRAISSAEKRPSDAARKREETNQASQTNKLPTKDISPHKTHHPL